MHDSELDRFKTDIHLVHFAVKRYGYERDPRESSRGSHVLRCRETHDKIVVRRDADGHWTYFSVRDERDNGTIVDFVQRRARHSSLREVREELRQWLGTPRPDPSPAVWQPTAPTRDPRAVIDAFECASVAETHEYLAGRGLRRDTLADPRFLGSWRHDRRGHVLFGHRNEKGELTGFEIKSRGFTGFSSGGAKSAWQSAALPRDRALVITESAIDALSHHQLHPAERAHSRYLSTAGAPSSRQIALLDRLFAALPHALTVVAAVDADTAGHALAAKLEAIAGRHPQVSFRRDAPPKDKDWNDALQRLERERAQKRSFAPGRS